MINTISAYPTKKDKIEEIYHGVKIDIINKNTNMSKHLGSMYWHKGFRIIDDVESEFMMFDSLRDEMISENINDADHINLCFVALKNNVDEKLLNKLPYQIDEARTLFSQIRELSMLRNNYKPLGGDPVTPEDLEKILEFANGMTPALSNEYNYRVDVVPEVHKRKMYEDTKQYSMAAHDAGQLNYAVDENDQMLAPTVLVWSLRYNLNNDKLNQFSGPITGRDPGMINLGMNIWHTCLAALSLGYKTSFAIMTGDRQTTIKNILGMKATTPQDDFTLNRDGETEFMPMVFLCLGTSGKVNSNSRNIKQEDIVNKLKFNEIID